MIRTLTDMDRAELELEAAFAGELWAFVPVIRGSFICLGIAVANEAGYCPVPVSRCQGNNWDEMSAHADDLNQRWLGLDKKATIHIWCSSTAAKT